jgi:hypothetical protein
MYERRLSQADKRNALQRRRTIVLAGHQLDSLVRNSQIRRERVFSRYQQKYQQNGRLPHIFRCVFKCVAENQESN